MPECVGHKSNGASWKQKSTSSATLGAKKHAELSVMDELDAENPVLLIQDAFPCSECHATLLTKSAKKKIIVKVEKDEGKYSMDHAIALGGRLSLPVTIYYSGGVATYIQSVAPNPAVPVAFNGVPGFANLSYY